MSKQDILAVPPLSGWPDDVVNGLVTWVTEIADDLLVDEFYIGRGIDLDARRRDHDADDIMPIYSTSSPEHAMRVEERLIPAFIDHDKNNNEVGDARGATSDRTTNHVYVALWWVDGVPAEDEEEEDE
jgi:hypothetical protein